MYQIIQSKEEPYGIVIMYYNNLLKHIGNLTPELEEVRKIINNRHHFGKNVNNCIRLLKATELLFNEIDKNYGNDIYIKAHEFFKNTYYWN